MKVFMKIYSIKIFILVLGIFGTSVSHAYSYAAAGKEPVIDARELIYQALSKNDYSAVKGAVETLREEFEYLKTDHQIDLLTPLLLAINEKNEPEIKALIDRTLYEEIVRRLDGAQKNLSDYQVAKVLVVKSKLFLDLLLPKLSDSERIKAQEAIQAILVSIGNPGVFGVGQVDASPTDFAEYRSTLLNVLTPIK